MATQFQILPALILSLLLQLAGLALAVAQDSYIRREHKRLLLLATLIVLTLIGVDLAQELHPGGWVMPDRLRTVVVAYGYIMRPVLLVLFMRITSEDRRPWILAAANALINFTSLFSGLVFRIENGRFYRGPMAYTCHVTGVLLLVILAVRSVRRGKRSGRDAVFPTAIALALIVTTAVDTWLVKDAVISYLNVTAVASCVFYYIWLHLQFVRAHEQALMAEQRTEILMAQIQPHFIFNSLTAIRAAYRTDAEKGEKAITEFADYLRHNVDALTEERMIPLERELEHVRRYLSLQQLRFGDKLRLRWELEATDFRIPTLTLQPLVENAVTYGVRQTADGTGTVTVRSREYEDRYEIAVEDDGPGFVPENELGDGAHAHVGLRNVRDRLKLVCGGRLLLRSAPGQGTTATIVLPKERAE